MNETSIQQAIDEFKQTIYSYIHHPSLQAYTGTPVLNENHLFIYYCHFLMKNSGRKSITKVL